MKNSTRIERLDNLIYMLDNHDEIFPKLKFNIDSWAKSKEGAEITRKVDCRTAACALGSACFYEPFTKLGLKLSDDGWDEPNYKGEQDFLAGAKLFGITEEESNFLFSPGEFYENEAYQEISRFYVKLNNDDGWNKPTGPKKVTAETVANRARFLKSYYENYKKSPSDEISKLMGYYY